MCIRDRAEWVTPGHPLFEAVREDVLESVRDDLARGAVFFDLNRDKPARLLSLIHISSTM